MTNRECSIEYTIDKIGGKWKCIILWHLCFDGKHRYSELKKLMPNITHKMLSQQLKELIKDKLINRKQYNQIPLKVEYTATSKGETLKPILELMHNWGTNN